MRRPFLIYSHTNSYSTQRRHESHLHYIHLRLRVNMPRKQLKANVPHNVAHLSQMLLLEVFYLRLHCITIRSVKMF